ncbi:MAG: hypothetical protein ACP5NV_06850 [Candidatus Woesearchaeota archaeon]
MKHAFIILAFLALLFLVGCTDGDISSFVNSQNLTDVHSIKTTALDKEHDVRLFLVSYGPAMDCQSGCIYTGRHGLAYNGRIGWLQEGLCLENYTVYCINDTFEYESGDEYLVSDEFLTNIEGQPMLRYFLVAALQSNLTSPEVIGNINSNKYDANFPKK